MSDGLYTKKGENAQRSLFSSRDDDGEKLADLTSTSSPPIWLRAVVLDVIFDPNSIGDENLDALRGAIKNPELLSKVPRNSIIAVIVSNAEGQRDQSPYIFYPMLSHTHEPIKPGEHVWVMFENPHQQRNQGFWLSRIVEPLDVEDPNFTHADRKFYDKRDPTTIERSNGDVTTNQPTFPNGANTGESLTILPVDMYERIYKEALANSVVVYEPVPRFNKRPGDWAAQGSNNSLIVLGTDRTGSAAKVTGGAASGLPEGDKPQAAGMWDLVVGRGRKLQAPGAPAQKTEPRTIQNTRGNLETDKAPADGKQNPNEGDPDFELDAARVYGAMDTAVDKNFNITGNIPTLNGGVTPDDVETGSAVIAKADHVRVISRKDGSIRIVKEGAEDKDRAVIIMEKDGTIMIDGPVVIIGSGKPAQDNGAGKQIFLGRDASESIVLGDTMKQVLSAYADQVQAAFDNLGKAIAQFTTLGNFGIPIPDLVALVAGYPTSVQQIVDQATDKFKTDLKTTLSRVGKTQ